MTTTKKFDRKRLKEILENYDGNLRMFDTLRSNSYEQVLAAHSLEDLDSFYSKMFAPGVSLKKAAATCPPWPCGENEGEPPCEAVLEKIAKRFKAERNLLKLTAVAEKAAIFRRIVKGLPPSEQLKMLDELITHEAQKAMAGALDGLPESERKGPVERLIARQKLSQREGDLGLKKKRLRLEAKKVKLLENKCAQDQKDKQPEGTITKEGWEQLERELKLI